MKEYDVVGRYGLVKLVRAVNDLDDNWECQGGILALSEPDNATLYLQAMVREVKDSFTEEDFENARTRARALQEEMGWRNESAADLVVCSDTRCVHHGNGTCEHSVPHVYTDECEEIRRKDECTPDPPGHGACGDLSTPIDLESAAELRRLAALDGFTIPMELRRLIWDETRRRAVRAMANGHLRGMAWDEEESQWKLPDGE